jgi:DNA-binding MarR family transcriptional regulator
MISELKRSECPVYHEVAMATRIERIQDKRAVAGDAWRLMLECSMAQFGKASGILQGLGLTPGHMKLLMQLDPDEGRSMGSLAQSFACDASTMTWLVDRLEERGLVERRALPSDRRVKAVALTPRGVETKAQLAERLFDPPQALLALDRRGLEGLRTALTKVRDASPAAPGFLHGADRRAETG